MHLSTSTSMLAQTLAFLSFELLLLGTFSEESVEIIEAHIAADVNLTRASHADSDSLSQKQDKASSVIRREKGAETVEVLDMGHLHTVQSHGANHSVGNGPSAAHESHGALFQEEVFEDGDNGGAAALRELGLTEDAPEKEAIVAGKKASKHDTFDDDADDQDQLDMEDFEEHAIMSSLFQKKGGGGSAWFDRRRRVNCAFKSWGGWGGCNKGCGWGSMVRHRGKNAAAHGGRGCHGPTSHTARCRTRMCPIHCKWGGWTGWTACGVSCGGGKQVKTRVFAVRVAHGGRRCDDEWLNKQETICAGKPCPINCAYTAWTGWTSCSVSCGVGMSQRSRDKVHSTEHGGAACPGSHVVTQQCNINPCPIDCEVAEWDKWSTCNKDCADAEGAGETGRYREMLIPGQHGGEPCPHLTEKLACNEDACLVVKARGRTAAEVSVALSILATVAACWH